ncbi:MAG: ATP synthase F1 subunit delta [bacterium]|nr:ATP synthase F1 subunit delta [bacterium]
MRKNKIAAAYANAIFHFAKAHGLVEEIGEQFGQLIQAWTDYPLLRKFFLSQAITREEKTAKLESIFAPSLHPAFRSVIRFMIRWNHIGILPLVYKSFSHLQDSYLNIHRVRIISSFPLDEQYYQRFQTLLSKVFTQNIILTPIVDPQILGGFIINSDSFHIDCSIKHELELLRKRFYLLLNMGVKN